MISIIIILLRFIFGSECGLSGYNVLDTRNIKTNGMEIIKQLVFIFYLTHVYKCYKHKNYMYKIPWMISQGTSDDLERSIILLVHTTRQDTGKMHCIYHNFRS